MFNVDLKKLDSSIFDEKALMKGKVVSALRVPQIL